MEIENTAEDMVKSLLNKTFAKAVPIAASIKMYPKEVIILGCVVKLRQGKSVNNNISKAKGAILKKFPNAIVNGGTSGILCFKTFTLMP